MSVNDDHPSFPVPSSSDDANPAADFIRGKLDSIYKSEPDAVDEAIESVVEPTKERSIHQRKMYELATSGKSLAQIQTEWHEYYLSLSNKDKHEVWQEFYAANQHQSAFPAPKPNPKPAAALQSPRLHSQVVSNPFDQQSINPNIKTPGQRTVKELKTQLTGKIGSRSKLNRKQHFQSLAFGLSAGAFVVLLLLFGFFNERFIAPFITPSRTVSATPLIVNQDTPVDPNPEVIIPKINVEAPVVYDVPTINEDAVELGLERGTVHYATTPNPGEKGNAVLFGHSSSNILNRGKYKFAFALLNRMEIDDTFYLQKDGVRYTYKIFDKKIVKPTDISVLNPIQGKDSTATLITCDPPGTSVNRLIIIGEQISPDPATNKDSTALQTDQQPQQLASNSETLWHRILNWIF